MIRWVLALLLGLVAAWLAYGRGGRFRAAGPSAVTLGLASARALAVACLAALLMGAPWGRARPTAPVVAIDMSASWRRAVGDDSSFVRQWRSALRDTVARYAPADAPILLFGDSLRETTADGVATLTPQDAASRLQPVVDRAASLGRPLVVISDGAVDDPEGWSDAPAGSRAVRFAPSSRRDLALGELALPGTASAGDTVPVSATLVAGAVATPEATVRLRVDQVEVASAAVPALAPFATTRITLSAPLPRGNRTVLVQLALELAGDVESRNDTLTAAVDLSDRPAAVFVSTAPDLDVREALTVLRGALDVPTRAYLRIAPSVWRVEGSLAPISEADVRARAASAGMLIMHGDTSWAAAISASAPASATARALWSPAPPTVVARAGETARTPEWYVTAAPASVLSAALSTVPLDSLPPITLAGPIKGMVPVLTAQLGKRGDAAPAVATREVGGKRTVVISGSGYAGWALRGARSRDAFTALWGAIFDWLAAGRGDPRSVRPATPLARAGEPVAWRRGGADSVVSVRLTRRGAIGAGGPSASASPAGELAIRFPGTTFETTTAPLEAGQYEAQAVGGVSLLIVNPSREWVPRPAQLPVGSAARGRPSTEAPQLREFGWPFVVALLLLCAEWVGRRYGGHR